MKTHPDFLIENEFYEKKYFMGKSLKRTATPSSVFEFNLISIFLINILLETEWLSGYIKLDKSLKGNFILVLTP